MRRKASMIVLAVLMAAGAIWTAVYDICLSKIKTVSPILDAASGDVPSWRQSGSKLNCNESYTCNFDNGTWLIWFEGQSGGYNYDKGGQGALCLAFYKGSSMTVQIGVGGGDGTYKGGGKTIVYTNFAKPIGYEGSKEEQAIAAGAGACSSGSIAYLTERLSWSINDCFKIMDGTFKGWEGSRNEAAQQSGGHSNNGTGTPATQTHGGYAGWSGKQSPNAEDVSLSFSVGGGAGYHDGGGGSKYEYDFAGGGSCSPNCYPMVSSDIDSTRQVSYADGTKWRNTDDVGGVTIYRIDPAVMPGESQTKQYGVDGYGIDKGISITAGELGAGRINPTEHYRNWARGAGFKDYDLEIEGKWVYSVRERGEWEGLAPDGWIILAKVRKRCV